MQIDLGPVPGLVILIVTVGMMVRFVAGSRSGRGERKRLEELEIRVQKIEEATSGIVAEFASMRERERFMRQLVETKAKKEGRSGEVSAVPVAVAPIDTSSPFVVQTVSAARRSL